MLGNPRETPSFRLNSRASSADASCDEACARVNAEAAFGSQRDGAMSGILGQIETQQAVAAAGFARMLATLAARGPDGPSTRMLREGRVALGHQRLALVDRSPLAAQPLANEDGSLWLTFDGAIDNFRALRKQLENAGHVFRSADDAEVVLHAYEEWRDECVLRLRGVFAFGLWDERRERLLLARDRLGVKPLYYWPHARGLVFASQPRAILAHPGFAREVDADAFHHYLVYGCVPGELAIWAGMRKLPAAHRLAWDRRGLRRERYWEPRPEPLVRQPRDAVRLVRDKLAEAVRLQLAGDAPPGVLLGAGVETSAAAAIATHALERRVTTFSVGCDAADPEELACARRTNAFLACAAHEEQLAPDSARAWIAELVALHDEPGFSWTSLRALAVSKLARRHDVRVILCGDGASELFAGHPWYDGAAGSRWSAWRRGADARRAARRELPARHALLRSPLAGAPAAPLLGCAAAGDPLRWFAGFDRAGEPLATRLQLIDLQTLLVDAALLGLDHASAACGVAARVPFLDHELVETIFSIAPRVLFAEGERKALLRRVAASWLPPETLDDGIRPVWGAFDAWLRGPLEADAARGLQDGVLVARGLLRAQGVASLLATGPRSALGSLWIAELWARHWLESAASR